MLRFFGKLSLLALLAITSVAAVSQAFPSKPVRIVVPQAPGGASDALARIIGQKLSEKWGQPVVIDNRAGAGGNIGMQFVATAPADGYTLLLGYLATHAINGALYKKLSFDPGRDFAPVATLATLPFVIVSKPEAGFKTVPELVDAAKKGRITYGSAGSGTINHLLGEMFSALTTSKLVHIPYRGAAPALQDLMGGQINVVFTSVPSVLSFIKNGTLRPIAVSSAKRETVLSNIPTIAEAGFGDFEVNPWFGLMAPAHTPHDVLLKINADVNTLLRSKEVIDSFNAQGAKPYITGPDEFAAILKEDIEKWTSIVKSSGARVD